MKGIRRYQSCHCTRSEAIARPLYILTEAAFLTGKRSDNGSVERAVDQRCVGIMDFFRRDIEVGPIWHHFHWHHMAV